MRKDDKGPKVRITDQFHDKRAMVYDLKCDAIRISISIAGSDEAEWQAEGIAKLGVPSPPVARGVGPSRGEALRVLTESWCSQGEAAGFPPLDWEAIRQALATVRAI